jgi:tetratricopeptide (TPR) repeat protein
MPVFEDIWVNLANVYMLQGRLSDACHLYQAVLKILPSSISAYTQSKLVLQVSDSLSMAYYKNQQFDESLTTIRKSLHYAPWQLHKWYNLAFTTEESSIAKLRNHLRSSKEIQRAAKDLELSTLIFQLLVVSHDTLCPNIKQELKYDVRKAEVLSNFCQVINKVIKKI